MTTYNRLKEVMEPQKGYTWGTLMKSLGGNSSITERIIQTAVLQGYLQEIRPIDGVNRSFRLNQ